MRSAEGRRRDACHETGSGSVQLSNAWKPLPLSLFIIHRFIKRVSIKLTMFFFRVGFVSLFFLPLFSGNMCSSRSNSCRLPLGFRRSRSGYRHSIPGIVLGSIFPDEAFAHGNREPRAFAETLSDIYENDKSQKLCCLHLYLHNYLKRCDCETPVKSSRLCDRFDFREF